MRLSKTRRSFAPGLKIDRGTNVFQHVDDPQKSGHRFYFCRFQMNSSPGWIEELDVLTYGRVIERVAVIEFHRPFDGRNRVVVKERPCVCRFDYHRRVEGPLIEVSRRKRRVYICIAESQEFAVAEYRVSPKAAIRRYVLRRNEQRRRTIRLILNSRVKVGIGRS